jgi:uncharacterized membrane protein YfhO
MIAPTFDPNYEVVLFMAPTEYAGTSDPGNFASEVRIARDDPLYVTAEVELSQPGFLVLSDLYYPGWEAEVDGVPVTIYQANACVRAVPIEQGRHTVDFCFKPRSLRYGAWISGLSALGLIALYLWSRHQAR